MPNFSEYLSQLWYQQFQRLVERYLAMAPLSKSGGNISNALELLATDLSKTARLNKPWTASYLFHVLHPSERNKVNSPSPIFRDAVTKLSERKPRIRKYKPRVYTPVESKEEVAQINRVPPGKRREILLAAAEKE